LDLDPTLGYWNGVISPDGTKLAAIVNTEGQIRIFSLRGRLLQTIESKGLKNIESIEWAMDAKGFYASANAKIGAVLYVI